MTWGAEDLGAALGALTNKEPNGDWTFPYQVARAQCLFAAGAAACSRSIRCMVISGITVGLAESCRIARRDGFVGRIAIHPDQIATINTCFTPSEADLAHARRVVAAFAGQPDVGTVGIDGKMYDMPHLIAAKRALASVGETGTPVKFLCWPRRVSAISTSLASSFETHRCSLRLWMRSPMG